MARKPSFSKFIRDARIRRGLTATEVAEQIGVSPSAVSLWEGDRVRPRDENLTALCKVLKLPIRATRDMTAA